MSQQLGNDEHDWAVRAEEEEGEFPRALVQCLPAVLTIILVAVLTPWVRHAAKLNATDRYRADAERALKNDDLALADLCYRKVAYLDPNDANTYRLALLAERRDQPQRALHLMEQIAPLDRAGYAPAHYWIAQYLGKLPPPEDRDKRLRLLAGIEQHLLHTLQKDPQHDDARISLGYLYWQMGEPVYALNQWLQLRTRTPDVLFKMAQAEASRGNAATAKNYTEQACKQLRKQIGRGEDVVTAEIQLSTAQAFLRQHEQAAKLLQDGWKRTNDPRYREALVKLYVAWFRLIPKTDQQRRLAVLRQALALGPDDDAVLVSIAGLADTEGEAQEEVRQLLEDVLADESAPAVAAAHFVLGTMDSRTGDMETARKHLEQAHQAMPEQESVANNLAWVLTYSDPPDLHRALKLADAALEAAPDSPAFRGTRGQILFKLERWQEAARDLEFALKILPNDPELHRLLAQIYEHLGDSVLADQHRHAAHAGEVRAEKK